MVPENAGLQRRVRNLLNTWGNPMKKVLIAAAAVALFATTANAGGIVPEVVIIEDTAASNQGIFVPIFAVLLLIMLHHG
jgi:hypothetical protein